MKTLTLIEWRHVLLLVDPRVDQSLNVTRSLVGDGTGELALLPERLLAESERDDLRDLGVDVWGEQRDQL